MKCRDDLQEAQMAFFDITQMEKVHTNASSKIKRLGRSVSLSRVPRETEKPPLTMIDEKPADGSKKDQDGHGMMKSNPDDELKTFLSRWSWSDQSREIFLSRQSFLVCSYTCSSNLSVYNGRCTYTHLLHAHFSAHSALTAKLRTLLMRVTYTHG